MPYMIIGLALLAAFLVWWLAFSREFETAKSKLRKARTAARARFSRARPGAQDGSLKIERSKRPRFGQR